MFISESEREAQDTLRNLAEPEFSEFFRATNDFIHGLDSGKSQSVADLHEGVRVAAASLEAYLRRVLDPGNLGMSFSDLLNKAHQTGFLQRDAFLTNARWARNELFHNQKTQLTREAAHSTALSFSLAVAQVATVRAARRLYAERPDFFLPEFRGRPKQEVEEALVASVLCDIDDLRNTSTRIKAALTAFSRAAEERRLEKLRG